VPGKRTVSYFGKCFWHFPFSALSRFRSQRHWNKPLTLLDCFVKIRKFGTTWKAFSPKARSPKLAAGKNEIPLGDQRVHYEREVVPVQAKNSKGQPLDHLWRVTVRARWQEINQSRSSQAELIVYQP